jgi:predicted methyltransferase
VLYIVPKTDLTTYDSWELGYERIEVTDLINDYNIEGGAVFAYRALPDFVIEPEKDFKKNIIELNYSMIIHDAFDFWGKEFEAEYKKSTESIDTSIIKESQKMQWLNPPMDKIKELKSIFK